MEYYDNSVWLTDKIL